MKIQLSREDKIELLLAIKNSVWNTDKTPNLLAKLSDKSVRVDTIPILSDEDIQKVIEINNELKKNKVI
ncbi:hypothetical protein [Prevotella dentasini]|uniref:hypothetical protein n=1 Tax=Prevotella dentasini TaxID=589537 RepID=UPI0004693AAC|nr:hypothetical protein [Prevotella dentasini]